MSNEIDVHRLSMSFEICTVLFWSEKFEKTSIADRCVKKSNNIQFFTSLCVTNFQCPFTQCCLSDVPGLSNIYPQNAGLLGVSVWFLLCAQLSKQMSTLSWLPTRSCSISKPCNRERWLNFYQKPPILPVCCAGVAAINVSISSSAVLMSSQPSKLFY